MRKLLLTVILVPWLFVRDVQCQCGINDSYPGDLNLTLSERLTPGDIVLNLTHQDDIELARGSNNNNPYFLDVINGSVVVVYKVDLDNNKTLCDEMVRRPDLFIQCKYNSFIHEGISIFFNFTDDFPPTFSTPNLNRSTEETVKIGTQLLTLKPEDVIDQDCQNSLEFRNLNFTIEAGNTNDAFRLQDYYTNNKPTKVLVVNKLINYENNETFFYLNISVTDKNDRLSSRKSYLTVTIQVEDVDDNDPRFQKDSYVLHVKENDQTSVGRWLNTTPPVEVYDPDKDVRPPDPLLISLLNAAATRSLEINSTTGEVLLNTTFDREWNHSYTFILEVKQSVNTARSSTATMMLFIDDVNDNRPLFKPDAYNVSIAEHSPKGTTIAMFFATDKDTGDNALFNYTLEDVPAASAKSMFTLETVPLGDRLVGVLTVRNASLLDREKTSTLFITVSTAEIVAADGGDCSSGSCNATVTLTLLDINDNSPVFGQLSYLVHLTGIDLPGVILTVKATDLDKGPNADVTYSMISIDSTVCSNVTIDATTGNVSLAGPVTQSGVCTFLVHACDNPTDLSQTSRCTAAPLQILLDVGNDTVSIQAPVPDDILRSEQDVIQGNLSVILSANVTVRMIYQDSGNKDRSVLVISAKNVTTSLPIPADDLQRMVDKKNYDILALFDRLTQTTPSPTTTDKPDIIASSKSDMTPVVIALIVVASVLLVAFIVAIVCICRGKESEKRHKRLLARLSSTNDLYNSAGFETSSSLENGNLTSMQFNAWDQRNGELGIVNPVFVDDLTPSEGNSPRAEDADVTTTALQTAGQTSPTSNGHAKRASSFSERAGDADSGVPSDRENGGSQSSSRQQTPVLGSSGRGRDGQMTSYLDAVLNATAESPDNDDADMVNVIDDPEPAVTNKASDEEEEEAEEEDRAWDKEVRPDQGLQHHPSREGGGVGNKGVVDDVSVDYGEQEAVFSFTADTDLEYPQPPPSSSLRSTSYAAVGFSPSVPSRPPPPPPPPPPPAPPIPSSSLPSSPKRTSAIRPKGPPIAAGALAGFSAVLAELVNRRRSKTGLGDRAAEEEDDTGTPTEATAPALDPEDGEDDEVKEILGAGSRLAQLIRPSSPPMVHRSKLDKDQEEEDEESPDEPEPDYRKKVRFKAQIIHIEEEADDDLNTSAESGSNTNHHTNNSYTNGEGNVEDESETDLNRPTIRPSRPAFTTPQGLNSGIPKGGPSVPDVGLPVDQVNEVTIF